MLTVPVSLTKQSIAIIHEHLGLWNEGSITLGSQYEMAKLGYAGSCTSFNIHSGLYEGFATFLEPKDFKDYKLSSLSLIDFAWLFELLNITSIQESEIEHAVHPHYYEIAGRAEWQRQPRQQAVQCCGRA